MLFRSELEELYVSKPEQAVEQFHDKIFTKVSELAKFCHLDSVNFEILLCSLLLFKYNLEYFLYEGLCKVVSGKIEEYSNMDIQSTRGILALLDIELPSDYEFSTNTIVNVYDCVNKRNSSFELDHEIVKYLNDIDILRRPMFLKTCYENLEK